MAFSWKQEKNEWSGTGHFECGRKVFTTRSSTLKQFPGSRLMRMLDGRDKEFKMVGGQIFVDRDGVLFSFILDF